MSGHGANPFFFNKKDKDWASRTLDTSSPIRPITFPFYRTPCHPPQSGRHMGITHNCLYIVNWRNFHHLAMSG